MSLFKCKCGDSKMLWSKCMNPNCDINALDKTRANRDSKNYVPPKPNPKDIVDASRYTFGIPPPPPPVPPKLNKDFQEVMKSVQRFRDVIESSKVTAEQANKDIKEAFKIHDKSYFDKDEDIDDILDCEVGVEYINDEYGNTICNIPEGEKPAMAVYGIPVEVFDRYDTNEKVIKIGDKIIPIPYEDFEDLNVRGALIKAQGKMELDEREMLILEHMLKNLY